MKPLFFPLKKIFFQEFKNGNKKFEYRGYGKMWNEHRCKVGRECFISCGYSGDRIKGIITSVDIIPINASPIEAKEIYQGKYEKIAKIGISLCI